MAALGTSRSHPRRTSRFPLNEHRASLPPLLRRNVLPRLLQSLSYTYEQIVMRNSSVHCRKIASVQVGPLLGPPPLRQEKRNFLVTLDDEISSDSSVTHPSV